MPRIVLAVSLAAGCSVPVDKHLVDALGDPLACLNDPPPTAADPSVTISGTAMNPFSGDPLANVQVEGFFAGVPGIEFTTTSSAAGQFSVDQATGGTPRTLSVQASAGDYLVTMLYPSTPLVHSMEVDPQLVSTTDLMHLGQIAGLAIDMTQDQILLQVVDCNGNPLGGATVTSDPPGSVAYFVDQTPTPGAVMTDSKSAVVFIGNVPPSNTKIYASANGAMFSTLDVDPAPGGLIQAAVQP